MESKRTVRNRQEHKQIHSLVATLCGSLDVGYMVSWVTRLADSVRKSRLEGALALEKRKSRRFLSELLLAIEK